MKGKIPVLMYHEIADDVRGKELHKCLHSDYIVTPEAFAAQMHYLHEQGFYSLTPSLLIKALIDQNMEQLPERSVLVTFDDGFAGNYEQALPILRRYQLCATFFVIVAEIGTPRMMTWNQLDALAQEGMQVQSHLMHHVMMSDLDFMETARELNESRTILAERLGMPVEYLSLPNGSYHAQYQKLAKESGYLGGFSSKLGFVGGRSNPYLLERVPILRRTGFNRFEKILQGRGEVLTQARLKRGVHHVLNGLLGESLINELYHKMNRISTPHSDYR
jgi:peptidoglycan/xylan/chitin deacetylase (PgdA/CDA1 family)